MRNLKRALSLAMASIMLLGMMVVGTSAKGLDDFSDAADIVNEDAVAVTSAIGIFDGYEDGEFKPENVVTRGEAAVIIAKILYGGDVNVDQFKDQKLFTDVPDWAEGYVNLCASLGIIAGYGDGKFGTNDTVTTAQMALMLSRALGYFQNDSELGDNWILAATAKATQLGMYGNLTLSATAGLTRDNVAEMVFNTLTNAVTVEYNSTFNMYYTTGADWTAGVEFNYRQTLGYKNFDLVYKDADNDAFGRPSTIWGTGTLSSNAVDDDGNLISNRVNISSSNEIISAVNESNQEWTGKVTQEALYDATGRSYVNGDYAWEVYVDGEPVEDYDESKIDKDEDDKDFLNLEDSGANETGNGVLTQLFIDEDYDVGNKDGKVTVVVIHTYVAEVYSAEDGVVTLTPLGEDPIGNGDNEFETTLAFEDDDIVYYTYSVEKDEIQSVAQADRIEGEVTRVRANNADSNGDNFTVDGNVYNYNFIVPSGTSSRLTTANVDNDVVAYLDAYGYVIYIDESAVTYDYAYVLSMGHLNNQYGGSDTYYARLVLTDGTLVRVETDEDDTSLQNYIVSYSVDRDGVYSLTGRSNAAIAGADDLRIENGVASMNINGRYTANSNTVFIVAESDNDLDEYDYTVYTGVRNVPDIDGDSSTKAVVATDNNSRVAKVVFIQDADVAGTDDVIFVRADKQANLERDSEIGNYYIINAVVDGQRTTLNVKQNSSAADVLVKGEFNTIDNRRTVMALKSITTNSDGLVTSVRAYDVVNASGDGYDIATGTRKAENQTVGMGYNDTEYYGYTDDVVVVRYSTSNAFSISRISSIRDDSDDGVVYVLDGDTLIGICIIEDRNAAEKPDERPVEPQEGTVTVTNSDKLTVTGATTITSEAGTTLTIAANEGYTIESIACEGATAIVEGLNSWTVVIPAGTEDVTVTVTVTEDTYNVTAPDGYTVNIRTLGAQSAANVTLTANEAGAAATSIAVVNATGELTLNEGTGTEAVWDNSSIGSEIEFKTAQRLAVDGKVYDAEDGSEIEAYADTVTKVYYIIEAATQAVWTGTISNATGNVTFTVQ